MALIEVSNLTRLFNVGEEQVRALDGVSLSVEAGEFVAITGPSGSGKSTLMHLLGLLDSPSAGTYLLDGQPVQDLTDDARAALRNKRLGFVFQNFYLLPRATALRNVCMPLVYAAGKDSKLSQREMEDRAKHALAQVSLSDRMLHKPNELSGGQRQRVAIARALINNPDILCADEPTGNLDSAHGGEILDLFQNLQARGVTILLVTHDPTVAARASRRILLRDGKIVEDQRAAN